MSLCEQVGELLPNLDAVNSVKECEEHRNALEELEVGLGKLKLYAETKADAIAYRLEGNIEDAVRLEATCEHIYRSLPSWAKW